MANTLYDYYTGKGQKLPSVQERAPLYQQYGGTGTYTGSAEQNTFLLGKLQAPAPAQTTHTAIPATGLNQTTQPMQVTPFTAPPPPTIDPVVQQLQAQQQQAIAAQEAAQKEQGTILSSVESLLNQQGQYGARQGELEGQAGLPDLQKNLANINAQINQTVGQAFSEQQAAEGRLAPTFAIQGDQQRIEREKAVRTFGLSAAAAAIQGNIGLAQDNVKRALDSEFGAIESRLKYQQTLLDLNIDKLSGAQREKADAAQALLNRQIQITEERKAEKSKIYELAIGLAQNGAPSGIVSQLLTLGSLEQAVGLAAQSGFLTPTADGGFTLSEGQARYDAQGNLVASRAKSGAAGTGGGAPIVNAQGQQLEYGTPEYMVERLKQTAGSKTKLTQSEREQIGKFANVVALTDNLIGSLSKTTNDPLLGYLKSLNPYDFDARAVNAQVIALVPSVARGLYGEVGVLTDSDVERYLKTLPNIRSTADQNKFIAMMTLGNAKRSYEQTLLNAANSGVNVSGFVDSYKDLTTRLSNLEAELGAGGGAYTEYTPEETQGLEFSSTDSGETEGTWQKVKNWASSLFGL